MNANTLLPLLLRCILVLKDKIILLQVEKSAMSPALTETVVPNLPTNGRKMIDTLIDIDVDSAYK